MNKRQMLFVAEYTKDMNATQAAIRAGYAPKSARQIGAKLLTTNVIRNKLQQTVAKVSNNLDITVERILQERARLAFFDVRKLLDRDGRPLKIQDLDDDTAAAISGLDVATVGNDNMGVGEVMKFKLADKNASLTALEKHLGMYSEDNNRVSPLSIVINLG